MLVSNLKVCADLKAPHRLYGVVMAISSHRETKHSEQYVRFSFVVTLEDVNL